jgi:hypothetical protein
MTGPIFHLRLFGLFCPCFEKDEDKNARVSLQQLNALGARVDWHVGKTNQSTVGFVRGLFSRANQHTDAILPTLAQLKLVDATKDSINNGAPYAEIQLKPFPKEQETDAAGDDIEALGSGILKQQSLSYQVDIPLHHVQSVESIDPTMLVIITRDIHSTDEKKSTKEAARISFTSSDNRDAAVLDLNVMVEWNRIRYPNIEEDLPAVGLKARAQKAAHFAKRELEMRETKRTREQRKAKYIEDSGGLKYTAIAMANRAEVS